MRTGNFEPVLSWGTGINATTFTKTADGNYVYTIEGFTDAVQMARFPESLTAPPLPVDYQKRLIDFLSTAVADHLFESQQVFVLPRSYLRVAIPKTAATNPGGCIDVPMDGLWAEANAQLFGYGMSWNEAEGRTNIKFNFEARGPHFQMGSSPTENRFVPARIRVFLPAKYLESLGYSVESFDENAFAVTTANNSTAKPTLQRTSSGVLVNFGIEHYSAPDPSLEIYKKGWTKPRNDEISKPGTNSAPTTVKANPEIRVGKTYATASVLRQAKLTKSARSTVALRIVRSSSRVCRVTGKGVRALRKGTCRVVVTLSRKGRTPLSRSVVLSVVN